MSTVEFQRGNRSILINAFDRVARGRVAPLLALVALTLAVYLPGVLRLPAVDRTEIVFAETTRGMVERGAWTDPRFGDAVHAFRPIGTFWVQGIAATLAGTTHARDIIVYRLPSLFAVALSVLALFWLSAPRAGRHAALIAAGLFAVAPLTVLVSQLAIADGLALLPATVAMLCLMRLYDPEAAQPQRPLALLFWVAMGVGMLVNALHTPILVGVTILALFLFDRDLTWLRRTRPLTGFPIALLLAAPWIYVRFQQDGIPFSGTGWMEFLAALGGAQDMKLRAFPGTFLAAALLGFLPGVALLPPALKSLWDLRADKLPRFLLAWAIGYIVYLELLSSKPGTYTVQVLFPAFALAVALLLGRSPAHDAYTTVPPPPRGEGSGVGGATRVERFTASLPRWSLIPWPPFAALFALSLFAGVFAFARELPSPLAALLIVAVALMFALSADVGRRGDLVGWALSGIASLAFFAITLLGVVFPGVQHIWPAREIADVIQELCGPNRRVAILGFREPSAAFVLGVPKTAPTPESMPDAPGTLHVVESRWHERYLVAAASKFPKLTQIDCVAAYNVMRGCPMTFTIYSTDNSDLACYRERVGNPTGNGCLAHLSTLSRPSTRGCD
ncbi:MAG: glycosyl transferase family 39 [Hyphomicrobium sp.]|nr:MAG: glycosyl transferase family 39 [Hyphomicrobium sp.]